MSTIGRIVAIRMSERGDERPVVLDQVQRLDEIADHRRLVHAQELALM